MLAATGVSRPVLPQGVGGTLRTVSRCVSSYRATPAHHPRRRAAPLDAKRGRGNVPDCPRCDLHPLAPGSSICRGPGPPVAALGLPAGHSRGEIRCLPCGDAATIPVEVLVAERVETQGGVVGQGAVVDQRQQRLRIPRLEHQAVVLVPLAEGVDEILAPDLVGPEAVRRGVVFQVPGERLEDQGAPIERNAVLAIALGVRGTPVFVIGDGMIRGALPPEQFRAAIADARVAPEGTRNLSGAD